MTIKPVWGTSADRSGAGALRGTGDGDGDATRGAALAGDVAGAAVRGGADNEDGQEDA